jgi:hypothetical protein
MDFQHLVLLACLFVPAGDATAAVYRCDLPGNRVVYQELPCTAGTARTLRAVEGDSPPSPPASTPLNGLTEPVIIGSSAFRERTRQALDLLKLRAPSAYALVLAYVGRIQQAEHSGMQADADPPIFLMSDATAMYSVTWAAAAIAHDSYHSKLYFDSTRARTLAPFRRLPGEVSSLKSNAAAIS